MTLKGRREPYGDYTPVQKNGDYTPVEKNARGDGLCENGLGGAEQVVLLAVLLLWLEFDEHEKKAEGGSSDSGEEGRPRRRIRGEKCSNKIYSQEAVVTRRTVRQRMVSGVYGSLMWQNSRESAAAVL